MKKCARWVGGVRYLGQSPKKYGFFTPSLSVHSLAPDRVINGARKEFTKYGSRLMVRYDGKYGKDGINVINIWLKFENWLKL